MPSDSLSNLGTRGPERLSPVLQKIKNMRLHYTNEDFIRLVNSTDPEVVRKRSEDAILGALKALVVGEYYQFQIDLVNKELREKHMQHNPNRELFIKAVNELILKDEEDRRMKGSKRR